MDESPNELEAKIGRVLTAPLQPNSPNEIRADELRKWAIEYLQDRDKEIAADPHISDRPHWNLFMMDATIENALFAIVVFRTNGMEVFSGACDAFAIRQFAESDFPDSIDQLASELARRFPLSPGCFRLSREESEEWLGRGW